MPKVVLRPVGDYRGEGRVYRVRSASNPMTWYFVVAIEEDCTNPECEYGCLWYSRHPNDVNHPSSCTGWECPDCTKGRVITIECSCTGFQVHKHCWHVEKIHEWDTITNAE